MTAILFQKSCSYYFEEEICALHIRLWGWCAWCRVSLFWAHFTYFKLISIIWVFLGKIKKCTKSHGTNVEKQEWFYEAELIKQSNKGSNLGVFHWRKGNMVLCLGVY